MVGGNRGDQLSFEEVDDKRRTLRTDCRADVYGLHGCWRQERNDLFLCAIRDKWRGRERKFGASQREAKCDGYGHARADGPECHGRQ
jgi:hypothetical protein